MDLTGIDAAMYLRKSRAEDGMDTAEILRRHRETLTEYAARNGIRVTETYQEVVSGASLDERTEMRRLLEAVKAGRFRAVLCMDFDRLSRNETIERGIILSVFKASGTLIVTPGQVYDLSKESDELMAEIRGLFANYEYRKIRERMRRGVERSIKEGQFFATMPYGYRKRTIDGKHTLEIYEPEARYVRMIFDWYKSGIGSDAIATRLNEAGARPRQADVFTRSAILNILKNPTYTGKAVWNKTRWNGTWHISCPESEWTVVEGLHPAIISQELFNECREIRKTRWLPDTIDRTIKSPLAGLVRCKRCGKYMQKRKNSGYYYLRCDRRHCSTLANYGDVERAVIEGLRDILYSFETESCGQSADVMKEAQERLAAVRKSLTAEKRKRTRLYDFLESGTYTETMFRERMKAADERIAALESRELEASQELETLANQDKEQQVSKIRTLLDEYENADAAGKNALLHSVVDVILYERNGREPFTLEIFLR